ncbi:putative endonuclease [Alteribacillus persepolensis]|uniref:Putative endonuclease n=1 Tax=Alteribacillus persepolensis TaxID=568899 RepID=A0A1G8HXW8_9BACI|nr:GIY-YIG nuclease family protein [Alteribacillus persepolensis]SDI11473.1 putative endonuclease [Alteribacillus persepolensis]
MRDSNYYVYMLRCADDTLYIGYTTNIEKRLRQHNNGTGAKYTRGRGPFEVVYQKGFPTKQEAMQVEYRMKQLSRKEKQALIEKQKVCPE